MTDHDFFPPPPELSPGEIAALKRHLLSEIAAPPERRAWLPRVAVAAGVVAAAVAIAVALVPSSGPKTSHARPVSLPPAPLYSFHVSAASLSPDGRHNQPAVYYGDRTLPPLDSLNRSAGSRRDIPRAVLLLAAAQAHAYGNRGPTLVQWLKTTRQKAVSAENAGRVGGGSLPVYFVILHGHFVIANTPRPPGAPSPHGRILTDTIEITTGRTLDFGLSNAEPSFAKTGKPHHFVIYRHRRSR